MHGQLEWVGKRETKEKLILILLIIINNKMKMVITHSRSRSFAVLVQEMTAPNKIVISK